MRRPCIFHEQPHNKCSRDRKARLIKQPDRNKAEDERMGSPPEPDVLVKDVENGHDNDQQFFGHSSQIVELKLGSTELILEQALISMKVVYSASRNTWCSGDEFQFSWLTNTV